MQKRVLVGLLICVLVLSLVAVSFAYADKDKSSSDSGGDSSSSSSDDGDKKDKDDKKSDDSSDSESEDKKDKDDLEIEIEEDKKSKEERIQTFINNEGEETELRVRIETKTNEDGSIEEKVKVKLSNGQDTEIKVMPETASQTAIDKFGTKGIEIVLKEVGEGNNLSVVYEAEGNKTVKFLGLFKVRTELKAVISAENGEVLRLEEPWWYFLAFGKGAVDCNSEDLDLCDDADECSEAGLYWWNDTCNLEEELIVCAEDALLCEDDVTYVSRNPELDCEFDDCPEISLDNETLS